MPCEFAILTACLVAYVRVSSGMSNACVMRFAQHLRTLSALILIVCNRQQKLCEVVVWDAATSEAQLCKGPSTLHQMHFHVWFATELLSVTHMRGCFCIPHIRPRLKGKSARSAFGSGSAR